LTGRAPGAARTAALAVLAAGAAACAAPIARAHLRSGLEAVRAERSLPAPSTFGIDAPGVVHCHTRLSHDSPGPLGELVDAARDLGVRWICLTEHSTPAIATDLPRGEVGGVLLVPGEEVSRGGASVLALGVRAPVTEKGRPPSAVAAAARAQGGVALLGHVTHFHRLPDDPADGMAVYDLSDDFRATPWARMPATLWSLASGDPEISAEAYLLFVQRRPGERLAIWDRYLAHGPCAGVAECNAHAKFRYLGKTFDPYRSLLGLVRNHALVASVGEVEVLDAVRRGRLLLGFDAAADASGARFEAMDADRPAAAMGETVPFRPSLSLCVHLPLPARVRVLRDGRPWAEGEGRYLAFPAAGPGVYRAEASLVVGGDEVPWVIANPVRLLPAAGAGP